MLTQKSCKVLLESLPSIFQNGVKQREIAVLIPPVIPHISLTYPSHQPFHQPFHSKRNCQPKAVLINLDMKLCRNTMGEMMGGICEGSREG